MYYIKKPIPVEAIQWTGHNFDEIHDFIIGQPIVVTTFNELVISTLEGDMKAPVESWIIRGPLGEYYPCRKEVFEKTYEAMDNT